jgi:hypothetical protein
MFVSYTCHWTTEITQTRRFINLSKQTQASCLIFQNIWKWVYHFMTHILLIQWIPIQPDKNRMNLIDTIKTLSQTLRYSFSISWASIFDISIFCDHTFSIIVSTIRAWVRQIGMKPGCWRVIYFSVFCYCVDYSEFASFRVFLERKYPSIIWCVSSFQILLGFIKIHLHIHCTFTDCFALLLGAFHKLLSKWYFYIENKFRCQSPRCS